MPTEKEALEAIRNRNRLLERQLEASLQLVRQRIASASELIQSTEGDNSLSNLLSAFPVNELLPPRRVRGELARLIQRYIDENEIERFTVSDMLPWVEAEGHTTKYHHGTLYNTLCNWTKKGKLRRENGAFIVVKG